MWTRSWVNHSMRHQSRYGYHKELDCLSRSRGQAAEYTAEEFYVLLTVHPFTILQINPTRCTILLCIFISLLYMFRATMCPSSGELTVSMRHWYLSICMGGIWSAGWIESNQQTRCHPCRVTSISDAWIQ